MKQYPIEDIKAPAYLFVGGSVLFIKDNIKVQKTSTRTDVATSHAIKAGDIITDQAITIKGSPVAFSNSDALFKELKLVKGARIPKIESFYIVARIAADKWIKWTFLPAIQWSFENFRQAMEVTDFWRSLGNSLLITLVTIVLAILIHSIAGYVIGRGMARRKSFRFIYLYIVSGMFVPFSILMMPLVKQTAHMGLGNRAGVIVLYLVFYMPMNVLLYSGYLKNIPEALEEAADIDGASTWTTYWRVVFPMMKPMHATVAILTALGTWNDVMTPLVIMSGTGQNTLPLAQLNFQTQFGTNYNLAFASYILALIPILIFYMICQKQILNGVANGAVKG